MADPISTAVVSAYSTLPAAGWLLDGLLLLTVLVMVLAFAETTMHLLAMRRQRRERDHLAAKRLVRLQSLAERAAPDAGHMTMFKTGNSKVSGLTMMSKPLASSIIAAPQPPVSAPVSTQEAPTIITELSPPALADSVVTALPVEVTKPTGFEKYKVLDVIAESADVKSFRFAHVEGKPLAPFNPGQYLTIQAMPAGSDKPLIRCYSLSSAPHQADFYQISVKAVDNGKISNHLHRTLKIGDVVELKKPGGKFFLDPAQRLDITLVAGGIGITPCFSMAKEFLHTGRRNRIDLFYGCRTPDDVVYAKELQSLAERFSNFRLHVVLSRVPAGSGWTGLSGRIDIALIRRVLLYNLRGRAYYLCGPSQMMSDITEALVSQGVPESDVHFEAFGPAAPKKKAPPAA